MKPVQREVIDNFARERYREIVKKIRKEAAPTIGTTVAARLLDMRELVFRGRAYSVPPIPWPLGSRILGVLEAFQENPTIENHQEAAHLAHSICRPVGALRSLVYRRVNPFQEMTRFEVGRVLGFCWMFHVLDLAGVEPPEARAHGTLSPTSAGSSSTTKPGLAPTATRSPGATSSTRSGVVRSMRRSRWRA